MRDIFDVEAEELWSFEWSVKVEGRNVHGHELGILGGDDAVHEDLGHQHIGCGGSNFSGIVDFVAANHKAGAVGFLLLRAHRANEGTVGDIFASVFGGRVETYRCDRQDLASLETST